MTEREKIDALGVLNAIIACDDAFGNDEDKELIKTANNKRKMIVESLSIEEDRIVNTMLRAEVSSLNIKTNDLLAKIRGLKENRDLWKLKYNNVIAPIVDKTFSDTTEQHHKQWGNE